MRVIAQVSANANPLPSTTNESLLAAEPQFSTLGPQSPPKFNASAMIPVSTTTNSKVAANLSQSDNPAFIAR